VATVQHDNHPLEGKTVKLVRPMKEADLIKNGWDDGYGHADRSMWAVVVFEDGTELIAMRDPEGNGPGTLIYNEPDGGSFYVAPVESS
jgi:hypothetical protein